LPRRRTENGNAPGTLIATDGNPGAARIRPMCLYPAWPRYSGSGSENDAASFRSVKEQARPFRVAD
jgi:hypothetical protein